MKFFSIPKQLVYLSFYLSISLVNQSHAGLSIPPTDNHNYAGFTDALIDACFASGVSNQFSADCNNALSSASTDTDEQTLRALTPDEIIANNTNISSSAVNASFTRLNILRQSGSGASADSIVSRLSVYTNGYSSWQDYNQQDLNPGFRLFDSKATLGADYRFSDHFVAGLSSSYLGSDSQLNGNAGDIDTDGYAFAAYGSYYLGDNFFVDGSFSYSDQSHKTTRNVIYTNSNQIASAKVDSDTYSAGLVSGYNFFVNGWTITPTMRWMYRSIQMDGYTESMSDPTGAGGSLGMTIGKQDYESITGNFGSQISYAWSQSWGVLIPTFSAEYVHEFANDSEQINARLTNAVGSTGNFTILSSEVDKDYATISAGASAQFSHGISAFINYEKILDLNNLTSDSVSMGLRMELD